MREMIEARHRRTRIAITNSASYSPHARTSLYVGLIKLSLYNSPHRGFCREEIAGTVDSNPLSHGSVGPSVLCGGTNMVTLPSFKLPMRMP
jgi:hypothetical protein